MKRQQAYDRLKDMMLFLRAMQRSREEAITIEDSLMILKRRAEKNVERAFDRSKLVRIEMYIERMADEQQQKKAAALRKLRAFLQMSKMGTR